VLGLLAPEVAVEAVEGELSRHGLLPAKTRSGKLAAEFALGQPVSSAQASNLRPGFLVIGKPSVFRLNHHL
jgi:hypothetical protein